MRWRAWTPSSASGSWRPGFLATSHRRPTRPRAARRRAAGPWRVAVVGGGIAGLAAAYFLRDAPASVIVFEGSPRLGGKLAVSEVAGVAADEGAEALLARRPEGTDLIRAVGLGGRLVPAGTTTARVWTRGT